MPATTVMECPVCTNIVSVNKRFTCPSCEYCVCSGCQKMYMLPSCMNCRAEFTRRHLLDHLGASFVNTVLRRHHERLLMTQEKFLLPTMQASVDRLIAARSVARLSRFGPVVRVLPIPNTQSTTTPVSVHGSCLRCPSQDCRGYMNNDSTANKVWSCGICKVCICSQCHQTSGEEGMEHVCNPDDLTSIILLRSDSRSCPQCKVSIFKTEGCNHMHCTYCGTDFNWDSGRRIKTTTNHHYNGVANICAAITESSTAFDQFDEQDQELNIVPRDALDSDIADNELSTSLYEDLAVVRFSRGAVFRDAASYETSLSELRVRFLMNEITEVLWTRRVFSIDKSRRRCHHLTLVLDMYISSAREYQRLQFRCTDRAEVIRLKAHWVSFICLCNASFKSLHGEFGGSLLILRDRLYDTDQPPLLMQLF